MFCNLGSTTQSYNLECAVRSRTVNIDPAVMRVGRCVGGDREGIKKKSIKVGDYRNYFFLDHIDNICFLRNLLTGLDLSDVCYTCTQSNMERSQSPWGFGSFLKGNSAFPPAEVNPIPRGSIVVWANAPRWLNRIDNHCNTMGWCSAIAKFFKEIPVRVI